MGEAGRGEGGKERKEGKTDRHIRDRMEVTQRIQIYLGQGVEVKFK